MYSLVASCGLFLAYLVATASVTASFAQQIDDAKAESTIVSSQADKPTQFFWQSEVLNKDVVQTELAKLYVTLHVNGVLKTTPITIEKGETPTDIMIRTGVWPKWLQHRMPAELETALCDLNKPICSVPAKGAGADWSNAWPERTMNVPDVELKLSYQLSSRDWEDFNVQVMEVDTIETDDFIEMWCRQFPGEDEMCRLRDIKQGWAADEPAIFIYVDDSETLHKEYSVIGDPVALQRLSARTSQFKMVAVPVVEATVELKDSSAGGFSRITRSLSDHVLVEQKLRLESLAEQNKLPYTMMGFADANGDWRLPWPDDVTPTPIRIAHIDASADLNHCAFGEAVVFKRYVIDPITEVGRLEEVVRPDASTTTASTSATGLPDAVQPECGQVDAHPLEQVSHGTHTLGILVDLLTLGGRADPAADPDIPPIVIYHVPVDLSPANAAGMAQLYKAIEQFPSWGVSLVNISASWNITDTRPIERAIDRLKNQVLFVVAAGNEQQANSCTVSPACIKSKNVISVVALGADPQHRLMVLDQSNRGLDHDIGAFGADIVSAVSNNRFGKFSGTSQAAPLVSAVVAHLMRRGGLGIDLIYERIITTAKLDSNLLGVSQATMIDMKRAVDVDSDFLDLENGCQMKGRMEDFVRDPDLDEKLVLTEVDSGGEFKVSPEDLRRVFFNRPEGWHLVMYARGRKLIRGTYFIDEPHLNRELRFRPSDLSNCNGPQVGSVEKFKLADIKDLTMAPH
jgi:subtilisin family serine protease